MSNQVEVQVLVGGKPVKQYWHNLQWFVEARKGNQYEVKLKNNSYKRVLVIVSVDGLGVVDGKPATSDSPGYILDAYSSYSVKGFRVSNEEVNAFEFADKEKSYAVESPTGESSSANCGVIAVRVIEEKEKPMPIITWREPRYPVRLPFAPTPRRAPRKPDPDMPDPWSNPEWGMKMLAKYEAQNENGDNVTDWMEQERSIPQASFSIAELSATSSVLRSAKGFDMGTKFSEEKVADRVTEVEFEKGALLQATSIYYASRESLEEMGIKFAPEPKVSLLPSGFKDKYCQPPKKRTEERTGLPKRGNYV